MNIETPVVIKHHKEVHSFYIFVAILTLAIVILQPLAMMMVIFLQALLSN